MRRKINSVTFNTADSLLLASVLLPVIKGASAYCLEMADGVPADSMPKIIQASATGYIAGYASALFLHLENGLPRIDNGLFMASFVGGMMMANNVPFWKKIKIVLRWSGIGPIQCSCPGCKIPSCPCPLGLCVAFGIHHDLEPNLDISGLDLGQGEWR